MLSGIPEEEGLRCIEMPAEAHNQPGDVHSLAHEALRSACCPMVLRSSSHIEKAMTTLAFPCAGSSDTIANVPLLYAIRVPSCSPNSSTIVLNSCQLIASTRCAVPVEHEFVVSAA